MGSGLDARGVKGLPVVGGRIVVQLWPDSDLTSRSRTNRLTIAMTAIGARTDQAGSSLRPCATTASR